MDASDCPAGFPLPSSPWRRTRSSSLSNTVAALLQHSLPFSCRHSEGAAGECGQTGSVGETKGGVVKGGEKGSVEGRNQCSAGKLGHEREDDVMLRVTVKLVSNIYLIKIVTFKNLN